MIFLFLGGLVLECADCCHLVGDKEGGNFKKNGIDHKFIMNALFGRRKRATDGFSFHIFSSCSLSLNMVNQSPSPSFL